MAGLARYLPIYFATAFGSHWFCINIETVFVVGVTGRFYFLKGRAYDCFHFVQECCAESITEIGIIKITYIFPKAIIAVAAFCEEAVDMWVPFQVTAKSMESHDEPRGIILGFIHFMEHMKDNIAYGMEEAV